MELKLNSVYRFTWEDHYGGDWDGYAMKYHHIKEFTSEEQIYYYKKNMLCGNICAGVIELNADYDKVLESGDGDLIEDFITQNTFFI
jgi:hypothetical protein